MNGVHDMPELRMLTPKEAANLVAQAEIAELHANFWRETSTRSILLGLCIAAFVAAIIIILVVNNLAGLLVLILPVFCVWAAMSGRNDQSRRLRPRILALLKARSSA
jgi:uncharacterized membrane protein YdbT with pleckstrin-like domain